MPTYSPRQIDSIFIKQIIDNMWGSVRYKTSECCDYYILKIFDDVDQDNYIRVEINSIIKDEVK